MMNERSRGAKERGRDEVEMRMDEVEMRMKLTVEESRQVVYKQTK